MIQSDGLLRAQAFEAYEAIPSLDAHGELTRLILAEVSLLADKYRNVRRHDIPHIKELAGLLDVLWQEVEMATAGAGSGTPDQPVEAVPPVRAAVPAFEPAARGGHVARSSSPAATHPPMKQSAGTAPPLPACTGGLSDRTGAA